jgi:hypothetical protein
MELINQKILRSICISVYFIISINGIFAQNNLKGDWKAQQDDETCWAATLSNLTYVCWTNAQKLSEDSLTHGKPNPIRLFRFINKADSIFNFRLTDSNSILTYEAINYYLRYKYPRPLIHSYNFQNVDHTEYEGSGHFVNIVGCSQRNNLSLLNRKWLRIYDPKPDKMGSLYLKNYESYQILNPNAVDLQGTFFNFVRKPIALPKREDNDVKEAFYDKKGRNKYNCDSCFANVLRLRKEADILLFQNKLKEILTDSLFSEFVGKDIHFKKTWYLEVTRLIENEEEKKSNLETVEKKDGAILIINYSENDSLIGGTTLKFLNSSKKYIIDRVENISKYDKIKDYFQSSNKPEIVIVKDQFRFLRFKENNKLKYLDMDNLFKSGNKTLILESAFKQKILPHYLKVSEGGRQIIKACQKLISRADSTCSFGQNEDLTFCRNSVVLENYLFPSEYDITKTIPKPVPFIATYYPLRTGPDRKNLIFYIQSQAKYQTEFNPCPTCYPKNSIYYPYTSTDANLEVLLIKIADYQSLEKIDYTTPQSNWYNLADKAVPTNTIKQIGNPRLESFNGYMNTDIKEKKLPNNYTSIMSAKGIICDVLLTNGNIEKCYLLCNNDTYYQTQRFQWKE